VNRPPSSVRITRILILIDIALWAGFGALTAANLHPSYQGNTVLRWGVVAFSAAVAGGLSVMLLGLMRHSRLAYAGLVGGLALMAVATVFDDFGFADLVFVTAVLIPLILLLRDRSWYLQPAG
jgi:hypothetical protein